MRRIFQVTIVREVEVFDDEVGIDGDTYQVAIDKARRPLRGERWSDVDVQAVEIGLA